MKQILFSLIFVAVCFGVTHAQTWVTTGSFPGSQGSCRVATSAVQVGNFAFVGLGRSQCSPFNIFKDFWRLNLSTNQWTQMPDFPGTKRYDAMIFAIGNTVYLGGGDETLKFSEDNTGNYRDDFYAFNTSTNTWTTIASLPDARGEGLGFTIAGLGYIVGGKKTTAEHPRAFYSYNPSTNVWSSQADFPVAGRAYPVGFAISNKAYVGGGYRGGWAPGLVPTYLSDFFEYDPATNAWTSKGSTVNGVDGTGRIAQAVGIGTCDKGYLISGNIDPNNGESFPGCCSSVVSQYDPATNSWSTLPSLPAVLNQGAGWLYNGTLYAGIGHTASMYTYSLYNINGTTPVCSSSTFSVSGLPSGSTISWSSTTGLGINSSSGVATRSGSFSGFSTVTAAVTNSNSLCNVTLSKQVFVGVPLAPNPITVDATSCPEYFFFANCLVNQGVTSYTWQYNLEPSGAVNVFTNRGCNSPRFVLTPSGSQFRVGAQAVNACGSGAFAITIITSCGVGGHRLAIFPNPSSSSFVIEAQSLHEIENDTEPVIENVKLVNSEGVVKARVNEKGRRLAIAIDNLPKGVYYLHYTLNGENGVQRLNVE